MARRRSPSARRKREALARFEQRSKSEAADAAEAAPESPPEAEPPARPEKPARAAARGPTAAGRAAARGPRVSADGRAVIACPQCGTQYRVPEAAMGSKLTCKNCKRSFFPKAASSLRPRKGNQAAPFIALGAVLVVAIAIGLIIANLGPSEVRMAPLEPIRTSVDVRWNNPRVQKVAEWARAVHDGTDFVLARGTDFAALQTLLGVDAGRPWVTQDGDARAEVERAILDALKTGEATQPFRDFKPEDGALDGREMATAPTGTVLLQLPPREGTIYYEAATSTGKRYFQGSEAQIRVAFRMEGPELKVTGWEVVHMPRVREAKVTHRPHEKIAAPVVVERKFGNQTLKVAESELVALDHLDDTPEPLRQEIDKLIDDLMDLENVRYNRIVNRLQQIGRPAIPRLLNKMYEVKPTSEEDRLALFRVIQAMSTLSGVRFGYNPADRKDLLIGGTDEERISALRQWYAWWRDNHDRDFTTAIDKEDDESLFLTEEEKKAKQEAEGRAKEADAKKR